MSMEETQEEINQIFVKKITDLRIRVSNLEYERSHNAKYTNTLEAHKEKMGRILAEEDKDEPSDVKEFTKGRQLGRSGNYFDEVKDPDDANSQKVSEVSNVSASSFDLSTEPSDAKVSLDLTADLKEGKGELKITKEGKNAP